MSRSNFRSELHKLVSDEALFPTPPPLVNMGGDFWSTPGAAKLYGTPLPQPLNDQNPEANLTPLPDFKIAAQITSDKIVLPPILLEGVLHRGCKMILSGGSKSCKSWSLIDLAIAVSCGDAWWGMKSQRTKVLYINFELIEGFFEERIMSVCNARKCELPENLLYWNLRSKCYDLNILSKVLKSRLDGADENDRVGLIIVDPLYKALGDLDENSASDMTALMQQVEWLADSIGAAVVFASHFSKGNQSGKEAIDRPSGSGVFIRDPDAIFTMTRHEDDNCYVVESALRYMPPISAFVVRWEFPMMLLDEGKDPSAVYKGKSDPSKRHEGDANFSEADILNSLPHSGLTGEAWRDVVISKFQKAGNAFYQMKASLLTSNKVVKKGNRYFPTNFALDR